MTSYRQTRIDVGGIDVGCTRRVSGSLPVTGWPGQSDCCSFMASTILRTHFTFTHTTPSIALTSCAPHEFSERYVLITLNASDGVEDRGL
jgi:hypothetical protein